MGLSIIPVGGYGEVGRNCTAVDVDGDLFVLDLGLHLDNYVSLSEDDDIRSFSKNLLIREKAVPDISILDKDKVKAVLISHAHLDHVGAVPYLSNTFNCDIHGTAFTMEVARKLVIDKRKELKNDLIAHEYNEIFPLTDNVSVEFIEITHSTPQSAAIALHTPYGVVLYLNDFKLDPKPHIGNPSNLDRLAQLKPKVLILDTLYADLDEHALGEDHAYELLESALLERDLKGKNILVATFASHISRIVDLVKIAGNMHRKVMIVGRSMAKYLEAAHDVGISNVIETQEVIRYGSRAKQALAKVNYSKDYLFIVTGGMAEPKAVLSRIVDEELLPLKRGDVIIFSNRVIPTPTIIPARKKLESKLEARGFEILKDLHVSGHGAAKDHETILKLVTPDFILPVHGDDHQRHAFVNIAKNLGFKNDQVLVLANGEKWKLS